LVFFFIGGRIKSNYMSKSLQKAIIRTIEYGKRYGVIYSPEEVRKRLISSKCYETEEINREIRRFGISKRKHKLMNLKLDKARKLAKIIGDKFPEVLMVGVTGSVAAGYPNDRDDIDLMVITKKRKLWLARLKIRWFLSSNKIPYRRYGKEEAKDEFCFNLWLDEENLAMPGNKQTLKNAMDAMMMKPLFNKESIYERFLEENSWIKKWLASGYESRNKRVRLKKGRDKGDIWGKWANSVAFYLQYCYMKKRIKGEVVGIGQAFFHKTGS